MNPQPQGQPGQSSQGMQMRLLKPEQLRGLPVLTPEEITKYEEGLRSLWETVKNNPPESQAHINAKNKIAEFSRMVYKKISSLQLRQQQQHQQQHPPQHPQQHQHQQHQQQQAAARAQAGQPGGTQVAHFQQPGQNTQPNPNPMNPTQNPAPMVPNRSQGQGIGNTPSNPQGQAPNAAPINIQRPPQTQVPKAILDHVNGLPWSSMNLPQNTSGEQGAKYIQSIKSRYTSSLMTMEQVKTRIQRLDKHIKDKEEMGQPLSAIDLKKINEQKENDTRIHAEAQKFVQNVRIQFPQANNASRNGQGPNSNQQMRSQPGPMPGQNPAATASNNSMHVATATTSPSATTLNSKMPIPKNLPEKATAPPTAVSVGGGVPNNRPSLGGGMGIPGGVQGQPVIQKNMNAYNFDADAEHVMSKKKLDELTRQVVGGQPGIDGNYMTPDVEEAALNAADAFVDNVTETACRLAAARGSKVLETRDLQMAIERTYNIRIPGYTTDELRTVRKVQPHPSWIAKMSAIQAAKVTSAGKDDK
ncbi:putative transcription initiation factor tfiid subunit 12 protein [Eutypa lata UCREL1]|uniref:Putative transcription initiation factor tfiid subunit 12 protein n=1 Tax=Eutypa lata (strain UCR-EL1) TaxID=1287681 RepID=M7T7G8_EUTLA|nr:putative transcription initiation factor tfiid subunit 12 protein [Eutypa lata UCREL1]